MPKQPASFIALLRGINVGGHNTIPMPKLRALCANLGWLDVQSYIQSGNLIFSATIADTDKLEEQLERAIKKRFGLSIAAVVRTARAWLRYIEANPFPRPSKTEPNLVMLALSKSPPLRGAAEDLQKRATNGERVTQAGGVIWVHYPAGVARSKLSPVLFDRLAGSPVTARNWRTVLKLAELSGTA